MKTIDKHLDILIKVMHQNRKLRIKSFILRRLNGDEITTADVIYRLFFYYIDKNYHKKYNKNKGKLEAYITTFAKSKLDNFIRDKVKELKGESKSMDIYDNCDRVEYDDERVYSPDQSVPSQKEIRDMFYSFATKNGKELEAELYLGEKDYKSVAKELGITTQALHDRVDRLLEKFEEAFTND